MPESSTQRWTRLLARLGTSMTEISKDGFSMIGVMGLHQLFSRKAAKSMGRVPWKPMEKDCPGPKVDNV